MSSRFERFTPLYNGLIRGEGWKQSVIDWAVQELMSDTDTPQLRILAGLPHDTPEVEVSEYFDRVLRDLDEAPLGEVERRLGEARAAAAALLRGELTPVKCADLVHRVAVSPLNHPALLQGWCDLDGGFVEGREAKVRRLAGRLLDEEIESHAREFLSESPAKQLAVLLAEVDGGTT